MDILLAKQAIRVRILPEWKESIDCECHCEKQRLRPKKPRSLLFLKVHKLKNSSGEAINTGVDVMITIFRDFSQFSGKIAFFLKNNFVIKLCLI
jgi:hypothetical protein